MPVLFESENYFWNSTDMLQYCLKVPTTHQQYWHVSVLFESADYSQTVLTCVSTVWKYRLTITSLDLSHSYYIIASPPLPLLHHLHTPNFLSIIHRLSWTWTVILLTWLNVRLYTYKKQIVPKTVQQCMHMQACVYCSSLLLIGKLIVRGNPRGIRYVTCWQKQMKDSDKSLSKKTMTKTDEGLW